MTFNFDQKKKEKVIANARVYVHTLQTRLLPHEQVFVFVYTVNRCLAPEKTVAAT